MQKRFVTDNVKFGYTYSGVSSNSKKRAEWKKSLIIRAKYKDDNRRWKQSNFTEIPGGIQEFLGKRMKKLQRMSVRERGSGLQGSAKQSRAQCMHFSIYLRSRLTYSQPGPKLFSAYVGLYQ